MAERQRIDDFGEKIGGARKDHWKATGLRLGDLDNMTPEEVGRATIKKNVWPQPDWVSLVEQEEVDLDVALAIKLLRDSLPSQPMTYGDHVNDGAYRSYIACITIAADLLSPCRTSDELANAARLALDALDGMPMGDLKFQPFYHFRYLCKMTGDGESLRKSRAGRIFTRNFPKWPQSEAVWEKMARRRNLEVREDPEAPGKFVVTLSYTSRIERGATRHDSREAALEMLRTMMLSRIRKSDSEEDAVPASLKGVERIGPDYRNGRDANEADFLEDFGFRGVEFGNWTTQEERRVSMNYAYDALRDLAEAAGLMPRDLSLNGTLALAFGARGRGGRAAAHYETGRDVINLTKPSGAGSLAHEWFHAFDHFLTKNVLNQGRTAAWSAVDKCSPKPSGRRSYTLPTPPSEGSSPAAQLVKSVARLADAMFLQRPTFNEMVARKIKTVETCVSNIKGYVTQHFQSIPRTKEIQRDSEQVRELSKRLLDTGKEWNNSGRWVPAVSQVLAELEATSGAKLSSRSREGIMDNLRHFGSATSSLERMAGMTPEMQYMEVQSSRPSFSKFLKQSVSLDKSRKRYFSLPHEMGARAFESWVADRLAAAGRRSDYLVGRLKTYQPEEKDDAALTWRYPLGADRISINLRMDHVAAHSAMFFGHTPTVAIHDQSAFISYSIGDQEEQEVAEEEMGSGEMVEQQHDMQLAASRL